MKTGNAIILTAILVLIVLVGLVAAEDFMMPQEVEVEETISPNNSFDNAAPAENVKRHVPPRGVMQNVIINFWNPFGRAPVDHLGFKVYKGALWYPYPDHTWIQVAFINENKQINHIQVWDQNIANIIQNNYKTADNVTITMVEQPPAYDITKQTENNGTDLNTQDTEKINTTINLKDQKLANDTNTTITGTLLDENGTAIADAEVTITVNGQTYTETTDSNGNFTYEYNTESSDLNIGTNSLQVTYSGNETYDGTSKTVTITLEGVEEEVDDTVEPSETDNNVQSSSSNNDKIDDSSSSKSSSSARESSSSRGSSSSRASSSSGGSSSDEYYVITDY